MNKNWWQKEVFYQIYPASFKDSNDDGIGDIQGIIAELDSLKELGITTIWLSPIYVSPMVDNGYDIADYYDINPIFGSMTDFDELIKKAQALDMKIILDLVVNHTSDKHAYFQKALKSPDSPYRDFYIFKEGNQGLPPNNWRSNFGKGSSWEQVPNEDNMFYHHVFSPQQPDLNWENPKLREKVYRMINWWLDKGISGFRVDAITFIKKDQDFSSITPDGIDGLGKVKRKTENRPGIEKFLKELNDETFKKYNAITVGEATGVDYDDYDKFIGEDGYFSMIFDFSYADIDVYSGSEWYRQTNWTVKELREKIFNSQNVIQNVGWGANFLENHDQPRSINKFIKNSEYHDKRGAKALAMLYFFLRGCPFIYQGQELGMVNAKRQSIAEFNDVSSKDNYFRAIDEGYSTEQALKFINDRSRDNGRVPYAWNREINNGFNEGHQPWLGLAEQADGVNLMDEKVDLTSVWHFYKKLIQLRNQSVWSEDLIYGDFVPLKSSENVISYGRGKCIKLYVNLSDKICTQKIPEGEVILNNYETYTENELKPYQGILIGVRNDEKGL